jgi:hypothetical protein
MTRKHPRPVPDMPARKLTHAHVVQAATWLAGEVAEAQREDRRTVPLPLPLAIALADLCLEIASRDPERWL